jgi:hypothetical protein
MAMGRSEACRKIIWSNINAKPMVKKHRSASIGFYPEMVAALAGQRAIGAIFDKKGNPRSMGRIICVGADDFVGLVDASLTSQL